MISNCSILLRTILKAVNPPIQEVADLAPRLIELMKASEDVTVQTNFQHVMMILASDDQPAWRVLVEDAGFLPILVKLLHSNDDVLLLKKPRFHLSQQAKVALRETVLSAIRHPQGTVDQACLQRAMAHGLPEKAILNAAAVARQRDQKNRQQRLSNLSSSTTNRQQQQGQQQQQSSGSSSSQQSMSSHQRQFV